MRNTDLEHLTFIELLEEKVKVKTEIAELTAEKRVSGRPDDALYRKWLRRTNARLSECVARHDAIRLMLARRQEEGASKRGPRTLTREQMTDLEERRAKLRADLAAGGPDALLLRCRRLIGHLLPSGMSLEDIGLDADDRSTIRDVSVYLRARYGSTPLQEATR